MWLCVCDISPHPPAPPMRAAFSSWVQTPYPFQLCKTIVTSWKGLCGYDRDDMSCQDFCTVCLLRTFPSHYSICKQHVIRAAQHLHIVFSCFLIFCDAFTNWEFGLFQFCCKITWLGIINMYTILSVMPKIQFYILKSMNPWTKHVYKLLLDHDTFIGFHDRNSFQESI